MGLLEQLSIHLVKLVIGIALAQPTGTIDSACRGQQHSVQLVLMTEC